MDCEAHSGLHLEVHFKVSPFTPPLHFRYLISQYFYSVNVRSANSGMFHFKCCISFKVSLFIQDLEFCSIDWSFSYNVFLNPSELECLFCWKYSSNFSLQMLHINHYNFGETAASWKKSYLYFLLSVLERQGGNSKTVKSPSHVNFQLTE